MEIRIFNNADELAKSCADEFITLINNKPDAILGLATGASPVPTYKTLIKECKDGNVSFRNVRTYNLDEYCDLPKSDKNSYYTFMNENLFSQVDIDTANTHIPDGNAVDIESECSGYDHQIAAAGGIDMQLLGIGTNGHIGFNEPADAFSDGTFKVKLTDSTIKSNSIYFTENAMPHYALTMGIATIMKAKKILLIATGEGKADAVYKMIKGEVSPLCPASILQNHEDVIIFLDKAAASKL